MRGILPVLFKDFYKSDHRRQFQRFTEFIQNNLTARGVRQYKLDKYVSAMHQYFAKEYLIHRFNVDFFDVDKDTVLKKYARRMNNALGPNEIGTDHIAALHDLKYLPIHFKAIPEGMLIPIRVPCTTIRNTHKDFFWLPNFLETLQSVVSWHPMTSATISFEFRKMLLDFAIKTSDILDFVPWQNHDFSMRGHTSLESAIVSGAAALFASTGTDTIPAIDFLEMYYNADSDKEMIGGSISATEHAVMCTGGASHAEQKALIKRIITELYPHGNVSIVSDTWDYWYVVGVIIPELKEEIMARNGKVVIRPDSGTPYKIINGDKDEPTGSLKNLGTLRHFWNVFGGVINSKGYHQLDSHIGSIYGDGMNLFTVFDILTGMMENKFASTNMVFGNGSFSYQLVTRDTLGFAVKATHAIIGGKSFDIFKDPVTDGGVKKSAKGLLRVNEDMTLKECCTEEEEKGGLLQSVYLDGNLMRDESLSVIRERLLSQL